MMMPPIVPVVTVHHGVHVVRDDLYYGGTKARYIGEAFSDGVETVAYASPCEGGAQIALAHVARRLGKKAVIICAHRRHRHKRTMEADGLGATIIEIKGMTMFRVVQARAREIAASNKWWLAPFGLETASAVAVIAQAARLTNMAPDEVWCVASSGVLARGLAMAFPFAVRHVVQTGHAVSLSTVAGAVIHKVEWPFSRAVPCQDFPSDPHYDAKAWSVCLAHRGDGRVLFWNVLGN